MRAGIAIFLFTLAACGERAEATEQAQVTVQVTDSFGNPLRADQIVFTGGNRGMEVQQEKTVPVPYGAYEVTAHVAGFKLSKTSVVINQPQQVVNIGMQLGGMDGPDPKCAVLGYVEPTGVATRMRLVMLFGSYDSDVLVSRDGFFEFKEIECGDYVLIALSATKCLAVQTVRAGGLLPPGLPKRPNYLLGARVEMKLPQDDGGCTSQK